MASKSLIKELRRAVGKENLLVSPTERALYSYDSSLAKGKIPEIVVLPTSTEQVASAVRLANKYRIPVTPRGAGTNLSGGTVTPEGGLVISLTRMDRILEIDTANERVVVEPGVVNLELQERLGAYGYEFRPDPASQKASTLGGNIAENAGGPHCLKYGVTTNHVLGLEVVLPNGEVTSMGGKAEGIPGYDLIGLLVGSEGTFGIVTKAVLRISPLPRALRSLLAVFDDLGKAGKSTRDIVAAGILPAALEIMDKLMIWAVNQSGGVSYPEGAEAVLIVELDGYEEALDRRLAQCEEICRSNGAQSISTAFSAAERTRLWAGRKGAFGAGARISPAFLVNDGTVPRDKLPEVLAALGEIGRKHRVRIGNVFHAGDGNLHPNIYYGVDDVEERERAHQAAYEILEVCAKAGGTISGEHGTGMEKLKAMPLIFSPVEISLMKRIKSVFDPEGRCNPGKVLPAEAV